MPNCSFCDAIEEKDTPLCQSCGALRYPVATTLTPPPINKLKLSAAIAVAALTPGSFVVLALVGANKLNTRLKASRK